MDQEHQKQIYPQSQVSYGTNSTGQMNGQPPPYTNYSQMSPHSNYEKGSATTTVIVHQPQQHNPMMVTSFEGHRDWSTDLFDCFSDVGTCLLTCFCYDCAVCLLTSRTGECFCTPLCVPAAAINVRTRIRTVGGIRGTMCNDCMVVACCGPCAACQEARELNNMGVP